MKEIAVICYTEGGKQTGRELIAGLRKLGRNPRGYQFRQEDEEFQQFLDGKQLAEDCFREQKAMIFICAAGIAVRMISPFVTSKQTDPAVLVIDERGHFVIPLLSGHLGGANELAKQCRDILRIREDGFLSTAVITTATDLHGMPAIDELSRIMGWRLSDLLLVKKVSAEVLKGKPLILQMDDHFTDSYIEKVKNEVLAWNAQVEFTEDQNYRSFGNNTVLFTYAAVSGDGKESGLRVIPQIFTLGIGCKKGTTKEAVQRELKTFFEHVQIDIRAVKKACSIDLKKDEPGIVEALGEAKIPFQTYGTEQLSELEGDFSDSEFVKKTTGVGNVCERSAVAGCEGKGIVYIPKYASHGITIALAVEEGTMKQQ